MSFFICNYSINTRPNPVPWKLPDPKKNTICETYSKNGSSQLQNEEILRDNIKNEAILEILSGVLFINDKLSAELMASYHCV